MELAFEEPVSAVLTAGVTGGEDTKVKVTPQCCVFSTAVTANSYSGDAKVHPRKSLCALPPWLVENPSKIKKQDLKVDT